MTRASTPKQKKQQQEQEQPREQPQMETETQAQPQASDTLESLRQSDVMAHLLDALADGKDIGHYGRLVFVMVGHHFLSEDELIEQLTQDASCDEHEARSLVHQVQARDYNPPKRERILEWQARQDFPICPNPDDPGACNVYRDLQFPDDVYEDIQEFYEEAGTDAA